MTEWTFDCQDCFVELDGLTESKALDESRNHTEHSRCDSWEIRDPDGEVVYP